MLYIKDIRKGTILINKITLTEKMVLFKGKRNIAMVSIGTANEYWYDIQDVLHSYVIKQEMIKMYKYKYIEYGCCRQTVGFYENDKHFTELFSGIEWFQRIDKSMEEFPAHLVK